VNNKKWFLLPVGVVLALVGYHLFQGVVLSVDGRTFDGWSNMVLAQNYSLSAYWQTMGGPERLYLVSMFGIAFLKDISGSAWPAVWFITNLSFVALIMVMFVAVGKRLGLDARVIALSSLLFLLSADYLTWPRYLLTDTFLAMLVMLALFLALQPISRLKIVLQCAVLLTTAFARPAAIPVVLAFCAFYFVIAFNFETASRHVALISIIAVTAVASVAYAGIMLAHYEQWLPPTRAFDYLGLYAHRGVVIIHREETAIAMQNSFFDYLRLFYTRFFSFYTPLADSFSLRHTVFNVLLHSVVGLAILRLYLRPPALTQTQRRAVLMVTLLAVSVALFHTVTIIDYDFRYRYPIIAPLFLIVAIALQSSGSLRIVERKNVA